MDDDQEQENPVENAPLRRCAKCGQDTLRPHEIIREKGLGSSATAGIRYRCENCRAELSVVDEESLVVGGFVALFWAIVAAFFFYQGPVWYLSNLSYLGTDDIPLLFADILFLVFSIAVAGFSIYVIWLLFGQPIVTKLRNPVATTAEIPSGRDKRHKREILTNILLYPALFWLPFFGLLWLLDRFGFDLHDQEVLKYIAAAGALALVLAIARKLKIRASLVFIGSAVWLVVGMSALYIFM